MVKSNQLRKGARKSLPFDGSSACDKRLPKAWGPKQRTWILAGLKHLKAPIVPRFDFEDSFCFERPSHFSPKGVLFKTCLCAKEFYPAKMYFRFMSHLRFSLPSYRSCFKFKTWTFRSLMITWSSLQAKWQSQRVKSMTFG